MSETSQSGAPGTYRVLARKYRPQTFADLVGQDTLVRTLANAFESGRVAHAFLLTGVRGIGKTTTARLIARALNCVGADGAGGPSVAPCGVCDSCRAIAADRHVDVLEMDAASRTGVDDMRALIDGVRYAPVTGRAKVYIIDEVHMLSKSAFNALLKTLEEPPPHVTFVFATTEVRKLPLTVLSRCQRFDLRRVEPAELGRYLDVIARKEGAAVADGALALISRAAEGSVRDGLSLLDQALALSPGTVTEAAVQEMLGLADRGRTFDLFESLLGGDISGALSTLGEQHASGADPVTVLQDLLELTHWITRLKVVPEADDVDARTRAERERGGALAARAPMPALGRAWQMLLKGLADVQFAPDPLTAVEMVLIRLAFVADLPPPAEVVERLTAGPQPTQSVGGASAAPAAQEPAAQRALAAQPAARPAPQAAAAPERAPEHVPESMVIADFPSLVHAAGERGEPRLRAELASCVHLVRFESRRIEFRPAPAAPPDLAPRIRERLQAWTGHPWVVAISSELGAPTLREAEEAERAARLRSAAEDPTVRAVLDAFPGAEIREVRDLPSAQVSTIGAHPGGHDE